MATTGRPQRRELLVPMRYIEVPLEGDCGACNGSFTRRWRGDGSHIGAAAATGRLQGDSKACGVMLNVVSGLFCRSTKQLVCCVCTQLPIDSFRELPFS